MEAALDPALLLELTERLVACSSVSPDLEGEARVAREIAENLPPRIEHGEWPAADGRPVLWAFVPGRKPDTVVLLGHSDTVGVGEFAALGAADGERLAFDCEGLRDRLIREANQNPTVFSSEALADIEREERKPGTWLFGRGALDMKSALAVAIGVMTVMATRRPRPACGVLLVVTPDEEHESLGMMTALRALREMRDARGLLYAGVLNLDYTPEPAAYLGAMGKIEAGVYVLGRAAHAALPFDGVDAAHIAAAVAARVAGSREMVDVFAERRGMPAVILRLRDLKTEYNVQTALEAWVEFNVLTIQRPLEDTFAALRLVVGQALQEVLRKRIELATWIDPLAPERPVEPDVQSAVLTYSDLLDRAEVGVEFLPEAARGPGVDARAATLEHLRALCRLAGVAGPAIVLHLLPPFYPHAAPGSGLLSRATMAALVGERGLAVRPFYPLISDGCYASWRGEPPERIARYMPALGREYTLPHADAAALDLDLVRLGPWGHDAHGLCERVNMAYAFERLPLLILKLLDQVSELADGAPESK